MAFTRVNGASWGVGDRLTSAQINSLDTDHANAVDKTSAGDTLSGLLTLTGVARFLLTSAVGSDSNATISVGTASIYRLTSAITAARTYSLSNTSAQTADEIVFYAESSLGFDVTIKDNGGTNTLFVVGNSDTADGPWCSVIFRAGAWVLKQAGPTGHLHTQSFTTVGTTAFVVPRGVTSLAALGWGSGGGGGGGAGGATVISQFSTGGGGGAGGHFGWGIMTVTPGTSLNIVIGAGGSSGTGGASGSSAGNGGNGVDCSIGGSLMVLKGGKGGAGGTSGVPIATFPVTLGGHFSDYAGGAAGRMQFSVASDVAVGPCCGGHAAADQPGMKGGETPFYLGVSSTPGSGGGVGSSSGSYVRGGGGGGGGSSRDGGNAGGAGGNANSGGAGAVGSPGIGGGTPGGGYGGGGGGAGGAGNGTGGVGGNGGTGNSGQIILAWVK